MTIAIIIYLHNYMQYLTFKHIHLFTDKSFAIINKIIC